MPPNSVRSQGNSATARITCPWCHVLTSGPAHVLQNMFEVIPAEEYENVFAYKCANTGCGRVSMLRFVLERNSLFANFDYEVATFPSPRSAYAPDGVPSQIAKDFREAQDSRASGFLYGAAVVGRRVLQAAVRSFVGERRDLKTEIDALVSDQLPKHQREAAHEVRFIGNDAAHADEVNEAEVDDLLTFTEEVLHQLYVVPARVIAAAVRRAAKP